MPIPGLWCEGSRRVDFSGGYNVPLETNPFNSWARVLDCGDIPVTSYDNNYAIKQIERGHNALLTREPKTHAGKPGPALKDRVLPRIITLGGDHTIVLPILRSVKAAYGPVTVIHFDSHLDSWKPEVFGGAPSETAAVNHGTYFVSSTSAIRLPWLTEKIVACIARRAPQKRHLHPRRHPHHSLRPLGLHQRWLLRVQNY